jgi:hypothetical protein
MNDEWRKLGLEMKAVVIINARVKIDCLTSGFSVGSER